MLITTRNSNRTPRIALMGEFSAGKSTLCNMLMKSDTLPQKVTATQLAPVWMTKGPGIHMRVCVNGTEEPIELENLDQVPVDGTAHIRLCLDEPMLEHCDLIDCPGISDPNMDPEVWERVLHEADSVIWLTHATQAWRQSEAAVWDDVSPEVQENSLLLLTRWDKLVTHNDRQRVYTRVAKETQGLFRAALPISLTDALAAEDDFAAWKESGAADLMEHLSDLIANLNQAELDAKAGQTRASPMFKRKPDPAPADISVAPADTADAPPRDAALAPSNGNVVRIIPRRVRLNNPAGRERPAQSVRL